MINRQFAAICLLVVLGPGSSSARPVKDFRTREVDALFSKWNTSQTPGGVVDIIQDGRVLYRHAYGMANLDLEVPNSTSTVFGVGSLAKQFTAFAVQLLVADGKLSLGDDVAKYVPELHLNQAVTISQLIHHTSGIRDLYELLILSGRRWDDAITESDALNLIFNQNSLNFKPGNKYEYSNSNYILLALIVSRASGMSFVDFTTQKIFVPLHMNHTGFKSDYGLTVGQRANSYWAGEPPDAGTGDSYTFDTAGYKYIALSTSFVGNTGLFTTVDDLALWDANFYSGFVGGKDVATAMEGTVPYNNGRQGFYASGLTIQKYRGAKLVVHSGADAGYAAVYSRFPEQKFSVIIVGNAGPMNPFDIANKIADIYIGKSLQPPGQAPTTSASPKLPTPLNNGATTDNRPSCAGDYYSGELRAVYSVQKQGDALRIRYPLGELPITWITNDEYSAPFPLNRISFERGSDGNCVGFTISGPKVTNLSFERMSLSH